MSGIVDPVKDLERLQAEGIAVLLTDRPTVAPLQFLLFHLGQWIDDRHIATIQESFPDARRTFNPVFIHLPADGCRLTDLARMANMSKQAMAEIVDEMIALGYLARFPDPKDRRAKVIVRAQRGLDAHRAAMAAFAQIDRDLAARMGKDRLRELRESLSKALDATKTADDAEADV